MVTAPGAGRLFAVRFGPALRGGAFGVVVEAATSAVLFCARCATEAPPLLRVGAVFAELVAATERPELALLAGWTTGRVPLGAAFPTTGVLPRAPVDCGPTADFTTADGAFAGFTTLREPPGDDDVALIRAATAGAFAWFGAALALGLGRGVLGVARGGPATLRVGLLAGDLATGLGRGALIAGRGWLATLRVGLLAADLATGLGRGALTGGRGAGATLRGAGLGVGRGAGAGGRGAGLGAGATERAGAGVVFFWLVWPVATPPMTTRPSSPAAIVEK